MFVSKYTTNFYKKVIDYQPELLPKPRIKFPIIIVASGEDP